MFRDKLVHDVARRNVTQIVFCVSKSFKELVLTRVRKCKA